MAPISPPESDSSARAIASLVSLALGDALGAPVEFRARDSFPPVVNFQPTPHFNLPAGTPTDDTTMALCLASSLTDTRACDPVHQASVYLRWFRHGHLSATGKCFDIGNCTSYALGKWEGDPKAGGGIMVQGDAAGGKLWDWAKGQKGNGSLMRVVPVALAAWRRREKAREWAAVSSIVTHASWMCSIACEVYVDLVGGIFRGEYRDADGKPSKGSFLAALEAWPGWTTTYANTPRQADELREAALLKAALTNNLAGLERKDIESSGYVLHTLQAALWAFLVSDGFVEGARLVVNLGGDADTVGAVYGGLAGAWYGGVEGDGAKAQWWEDETVLEWRKQLKMRKEIEEIAGKLADVDGTAFE